MLHGRASRGERVLDAGCGTDRHAQALIELGCSVSLLDASAELLAIARTRCPSAPAIFGDVCGFSTDAPFDAITCRGVLNDLISDRERDDALAAFSGALAPGGVLVLDVREVEDSAARADGRTRCVDVELPSGEQLRFSSTPRWDSGLIEVAETYELNGVSGESVVHEYAIQMRPWTRGELQERLERAGFENITIGEGVGRTTSDRLLVVARTGPRT
ncbi:class I SAM-dependent methyltransferase [Microbacterium sp. M]|uniref:class I SAM-dependent methyltransferase n=1 Tax=Microbacterium sp. M TaxID=3377125 RepID=UPI0038692FCB